MKRSDWVQKNATLHQGNSVGVQPAIGVEVRVCIFLTPNRFASLGVIQIQPFGFYRS